MIEEQPKNRFIELLREDREKLKLIFGAPNRTNLFKLSLVRQLEIIAKISNPSELLRLIQDPSFARLAEHPQLRIRWEELLTNYQMQAGSGYDKDSNAHPLYMLLSLHCLDMSNAMAEQKDHQITKDFVDRAIDFAAKSSQLGKAAQQPEADITATPGLVR